VTVAKRPHEYLIFLVKHHDGSASTTRTHRLPHHRARVGLEGRRAAHVADACHKHDLKLIVYYSQPDGTSDYFGRTMIGTSIHARQVARY